MTRVGGPVTTWLVWTLGYAMAAVSGLLDLLLWWTDG